MNTSTRLPQPTDTRGHADPDARPNRWTLATDHSFSRNKNFFWYEEAGKELISFRKIVERLLADLKLVDEETQIKTEWDPNNNSFWLTIFIRKYGLTHRCCLNEPEFLAVQAHAELGPRLTAIDVDERP